MTQRSIEFGRGPVTSLPIVLAERPETGPLVDRFGRVADDLRVSVTDRCNFRCTYCMPAEGLAWLPKSELLTFEEMAHLVAVFASLGVRSIKVTGYQVRFIEYMPLDAEQHWERAKVVPSADLLEVIDRTYPLIPDGEGAEPASTFRFADGAPGAIGVIASVTEPFCDTCNRLRLTSDGQMRSCLFSLDEVMLRDPMRAGVSDAELAQLIRDGVARKWSGHRINH